MTRQDLPVVELTQQDGFAFAIRFDGCADVWLGDEHPPLGLGRGPTPAQLLTAAVSNCMVDALFFALRKFNPDIPPSLRAQGWATIGRNPQGRLRVLGLKVVLHLPLPSMDIQHLERILTQFEEFCTVGRSVAQGIPVQLLVLDVSGQLLKDG